jgi:thiosulfate/3-mercaptopyruvate sulfurtransferase
MLPQPLVDPDWLADHLAEVRVVDCRFVLGDPAGGRAAYLEGHIAGAAFLDVDTDLSGRDGGGRHPLPTAEDFAAAARRAGISVSSPVVAYDDGTGGAARLWWLLRHFGHERVAVLAGGLTGWTGPLRGGEEAIPPGDFTPGIREGDTLDADEIRARLGQPGRLLLDARAPERYRGEHEPIDPVAGHIPGARNAPFTAAPPDDVVRAPEELVVYCGSGITACALLLSLEAEDRRDAKLYPGSWSDWVARGLPAESGP